MGDKDPFAGLGLQDRTLIGLAIRPGIHMIELMDLIRTRDGLRTTNHRHSAFLRYLTEEVVIETVELVEFIGFAAPRLIDDSVGLQLDAETVRTHLEEMDVVGFPVFRIEREIGRDQVGFAIVIPERRRIVPAGGLHQTSERGPWSS